MQAIVLAAGYSTRLYPLTLTTPKPLIDVGGMTMLDRILLSLRGVAGIGTVYVVINEKFKDAFAVWRAALPASIYDRDAVVLVNDGTTCNEDRLGPVGDIVLALERHAIDDDLLVLAGDNLFELDVRELIGIRRANDCNVLAVYDFQDRDKVRGKFGVVVADERGNVLNFKEKPANPASALAATAIYLIRRTDLRCIRDLHARASARELNAGDIIIELLAQNLKIRIKNLETWFDIGTHEDLAQARQCFE